MIYETIVTVTVGPDERDCAVRGGILVEPGLGMGGSFGALAENIQIRIGRSWMPIEDADLAEGDISRATEALEEMALNDDRCCA